MFKPMTTKNSIEIIRFSSIQFVAHLTFWHRNFHLDSFEFRSMRHSPSPRCHLSLAVFAMNDRQKIIPIKVTNAIAWYKTESDYRRHNGSQMTDKRRKRGDVTKNRINSISERIKLHSFSCLVECCTRALRKLRKFNEKCEIVRNFHSVFRSPFFRFEIPQNTKIAQEKEEKKCDRNRNAHAAKIPPFINK